MMTQKNNKHKNKQQSRSVIIVIMLMAALIVINTIMSNAAIPEGPTISYVSNTTRLVENATLREGDDKGTITTINLDSVQQNQRWKAYVGNVTGTLTLQDADGFAIYDWTLNNVFTGNVFASRNGTINWGDLDCSTEAHIVSETSYLNHVASADDTINATFNSTDHASFFAADTSISGCRYTPTYVNNAPQVQNSTALFQQMLLSDMTSGSIVYTTRIENQAMGYNPDYSFDFQMIVPESGSVGVNIDYYFYIELQ
jgi:hypothetical protein